MIEMVSRNKTGFPKNILCRPKWSRQTQETITFLSRCNNDIELIWETNTLLSQHLTTLKRRIDALRLSKCRIKANDRYGIKK